MGGGPICRGVPPWAPGLLTSRAIRGAHGGTPLQIRPLPPDAHRKSSVRNAKRTKYAAKSPKSVAKAPKYNTKDPKYSVKGPKYNVKDAKYSRKTSKFAVKDAR